VDAGDAIELWEADQLITSELADRMRSSLREVEEPARANRLVLLLAFVGAGLIGIGLLLFISSQWDQQSPIRRMALLFAIYLAVAAAAVVSSRQRLETTAKGLWFLSSITAGVNIFLAGQIFNMPLNWWQGTALWALVALVTGWASPSAAQGWLAVSLGILTLGWFSVPSSQFFDQGAFLLDPGGIRPLIPLIGLALLGSSMLVAETEFRFLQIAARTMGVIMIATPLIVSTFHPTAFGFIFQIDHRPLHALVIVIAAAVVGAALWRTPHPLLRATIAATAILLLLLLPQVDIPFDRSFDGGDLDTTSWLYGPFDGSALLFWLWGGFVFGLALAATALGQRYDLRGVVNTGFLAMATLILATYIGRIAGALSTSLAVLLGGVLVVAVAIVLERKRRDMIGVDPS
jgi:hypothetical protein